MVRFSLYRRVSWSAALAMAFAVFTVSYGAQAGSTCNRPSKEVRIELRRAGTKVEFPALVEKSLRFVLPQSPTGSSALKIYPRDTPHVALQGVTCELPAGGQEVVLDRDSSLTSKACAEIMRTAGLYVVELDASTRYEVDVRDADPRVEEVSVAKSQAGQVPKPALPQARAYYKRKDLDTWCVAELSNGAFTTKSQDDGWSYLESLLDQGEKVQVVAEEALVGHYSRITFVRESGAAAATWERSKLHDECVSSLSRPGKPQPDANMRRWLVKRPELRDDWFYQVCVDLTDPHDPEMLVIRSLPDDPKSSDLLKKHSLQRDLVAGHAIYVRAFHRPGTKVTIDLSGDDAFPTLIYVPAELDPSDKAGAPRALATPAKVPVTFTEPLPFVSRVDPKLELKLVLNTTAETPKNVGEYRTVLRNDQVYVGAFRLGVAGSWAFLDRQYELKGSGDPNNPGREVAIAAGEDTYGLPALEVMFGYSTFHKPVRDRSRRAGFGWYFGMGIVELRTTGMRIFTSLGTGPEITFGRDVSVAFLFSVRRIDRLRGVRVGTALPASATDVPMTLGFSPQLGILVNFSPKVFALLGNARKTAKSVVP